MFSLHLSDSALFVFNFEINQAKSQIVHAEINSSTNAILDRTQGNETGYYAMVVAMGNQLMSVDDAMFSRPSQP